MNNDFQKRAKIQRTVGVATIIFVIAAIMLISHLKAEGVSSGAAPTVVATSSDSGSSSSASGSTSTSSGTGSSSGQYKDGTYSSTVSYRVPHSIETIKVTLTVSGGVVTGSQIQNSEGDGTSAMFQESFASEYKSFVVGKNLSSLNLDIISGASDTTIGFDQALDSIRSQAQG